MMKMEKISNWLLCPIYGNKTHDKIREDTVLKNYPLYCPKCKQETLIEISNLKLTVIKEPDAQPQGCLLEAVREQYTDFYRDKERWRYLQKLDTNHSLFSLEGFTDSEGNALDFLVDETVDIAETVVHALMVDRLKAALPLLPDSEQALIREIFFEELSGRQEVFYQF